MIFKGLENKEIISIEITWEQPKSWEIIGFICS